MYVNDNCVGCGQCFAFCNQGAIEVFGKARINNLCTNCGICLTYCPLRAIEYVNKNGKGEI
ncbi:MAG: 4Fe-4S binding protein [Methanosarcinaceae archaeon]|nr:4Fe-4S binding protein [Methanosarcinaceae archaeon]